MPKKSEFWETSETGNWNVASDFVKLKIMKPLYDMDIYETIAIFGTNEMYEEFSFTNEMKNVARLKAIKRLVKTLLMIVYNTRFAVRKKDKEKMKGFITDLKEIEKVLPKLEKKRSNQKIGKTYIIIEEEKFAKVLEILINIKSEINEPLNNADLIFTKMDEFDPKAAKDQIKKDLTLLG